MCIPFLIIFMMEKEKDICISSIKARCESFGLRMNSAGMFYSIHYVKCYKYKYYISETFQGKPEEKCKCRIIQM